MAYVLLAYSDVDECTRELEKLKNKYEKDTKNYETYLEQLTQISKNREELILEYEAQNKEQKLEINLLEQKLASYNNSETRDMLTNQGFGDLVNRMPWEQIANLLVERSRLLDELEEVKAELEDERKKRQHFEMAQKNVDLEDRGKKYHYKLTPQSHHPNSDAENIESEKNKLNRLNNIHHTNSDFQQYKENCVLNNENINIEKNKYNEKSTQLNLNKDVENCKESYKQQFNEVSPDLKIVLRELKECQEKLADYEILKESLQKKNEEFDKLKYQLDEVMTKYESELRKTSQMNLKETITNLKHRRDNGHDELTKHGEKIEKMLLSFESQLQSIKSNANNKSSSDENTAPLLLQLHKVQNEFDYIKVELVKMIDKYDMQAKKFQNFKLTSQNREFKNKETFKREKIEMMEQIEDINHKLILTQDILDRELEYKTNIEKTYKTLLDEQKHLFIQIKITMNCSTSWN